MFYSVILYFIHACIDVFIFLKLLYRDLQRCIRCCFNFIVRFLPVNELSKQVRLKRLPDHLGIIIREDCISFSDISNIINWSLCQGIHHVSIYDERGTCAETFMSLSVYLRYEETFKHLSVADVCLFSTESCAL